MFYNEVTEAMGYPRPSSPLANLGILMTSTSYAQGRLTLIVTPLKIKKRILVVCGENGTLDRRLG